MKMLVIGGTRFLGKAMVEAALEAGYDVTMFNRGKTNPDLFPNVEAIHGDRMNPDDLKQVQGREWDAVVDTCGYIPRAVALSTEALADTTAHYTFISTISVYDESVHSASNITENAPLSTLEDETVEEVTGATYGGLKVLCEAVAEKNMPGRVLNVRSGLIIGPFDPTDRFTYWPVKVSQGGEMLTPPFSARLQVVDARDQANWVMRMAEHKQAGIYNLTGHTTTFGDMLETCQRVVGDGAAWLAAADEDFLLEHEVQPWVDLPLWLPSGNDGLSQVSVEKALAMGMSFRPLGETVHDTLAWYRAEHEGGLSTGLSSDREAELLAAWKTAKQ
ncbi:MAG: SDR family oxidoreductase [Anaerolineae bacterium]